VKSTRSNEKGRPRNSISIADSYAELIDDPARNRFAQDPLHFHRRKGRLIEGLLKPGWCDFMDAEAAHGKSSPLDKTTPPD
jgi:hypothetical protein